MNSSKRWELLKKSIKKELGELEDEMYVLQDLKLHRKRYGQYEENFHYHRTYSKVLTLMRKLEQIR